MYSAIGELIGNAEADRRYEDDKMRQHHTFLFILNSRNNLNFVPLRDYRLFLDTVDRVYPADRSGERDG